jgi:hypothetical protein
MVDQYKEWFKDMVKQLMVRLAVGNYVVLLQSDARMMNNKQEAYEWLDKSHLANAAADETGCTLVWHKILLTGKDAHKRSTGRPCFSHLVCFVKNPPSEPVTHLCTIQEATANKIAHRTSYFAIPDIFYRGEMLWPKGIGLDSCYVGVMFLKHIGKAEVILDPFCGIGTVLAMSNVLGVNAKGVEISGSRCRKSKKLVIKEEQLNLISPQVKDIKVDLVEERFQKRSQDHVSASETGLEQNKLEFAEKGEEQEEDDDDNESNEEDEKENNTFHDKL